MAIMAFTYLRTFAVDLGLGPLGALDVGGAAVLRHPKTPHGS